MILRGIEWGGFEGKKLVSERLGGLNATASMPGVAAAHVDRGKNADQRTHRSANRGRAWIRCYS